jgi:DNA-binding beta-propeller fold protein YncE
LLALGLALAGLGLYVRAEGEVLAWWATLGAGVAAAALLAGAVLTLVGVRDALRDMRSLGLVIVVGTLCLPFLAPFVIQEIGPVVQALGLEMPAGGIDPLNYQAPMIYYSAAITGLALAISAAIGLVWSWRRWTEAAAVFGVIFVVFFTTFFTNGVGVASGLVGSLGYWLKQQAVERGSQPEYYYVVMVSMYEYLPWFLAALGGLHVAVRLLLGRGTASDDGASTMPVLPPDGDAAACEAEAAACDPEGGQVSGLPALGFAPFLVFWSLAAWLGYSIAGERMPWLTVHVAVPMILLAGWFCGRLADAVDWAALARRRAWIVAPLLPPFTMAVVALVRASIAGPFQGLTLPELRETGRFLGAIVGTVGLGCGLMYAGWRVGWRRALTVAVVAVLLVPIVLTVRTAWRFSFINYDYATEHLVYAHGAPGVHRAMRELRELSSRVAGGPEEIAVAYGSDGSTFWYWQLRNFAKAVHFGDTPSRDQMELPVVIAGSDQWDVVSPYLGDDYVYDTYTYIWWPIEDYRNLTIDRITHAITDTQTRAALWDIWYDRDYRRYEELTGRTHTVDKWPLRQDFRFYVRRDVATQIWDLGAVTGVPVEEGPADPYEGGWVERTARLVIGSEGSASGQLLGPRGIAVDGDGFIYVADSGNHRIQKFSPDGRVVAAFGRQSAVEDEAGVPQGFNEPWGLDLSPSGDIYVADTWNHRIQVLDPNGRVLGNWGEFGQVNVSSPSVLDLFYGPRDVAIGPGGRIYVTDTGNKRVQVYEPDGALAFEWGGGGIAAGYLDEPVGIAIGPGGDVYVADSWNRRVQVFDSQGGFLREWPIAGWDETSIEDKPYLAVDPSGYVYVTDPSKYRVLVFDSLGGYVMSFGQYGFDDSSFALPTGIAIGDDASVYVTDARSGRVLVFDRLPLGVLSEMDVEDIAP